MDQCVISIETRVLLNIFIRMLFLHDLEQLSCSRFRDKAVTSTAATIIKKKRFLGFAVKRKSKNKTSYSSSALQGLCSLYFSGLNFTYRRVDTSVFSPKTYNSTPFSEVSLRAFCKTTFSVFPALIYSLICHKVV